MSDAHDNMIESHRSAALAGYLGITADELNECQYEVLENRGVGGNTVYNYYIEFHQGTPAHILHKIKGLQDLTVHDVPLSLFDRAPDKAENKFDG